MKARWIRHVLEELPFLRSVRDVKAVVNSIRAPLVARRVASRTVHTPAPLGLQIEPTNVCNLNCTCCGRRRMSRKRGFMDLDVFDTILEDPSFRLAKRVYLFLHGESLLHPQLTEMIRRIKLKKLPISLTTNGVKLNDDNCRKILALDLDRSDVVTISMLGFSDKTHESIQRGVDHQLVVGNVMQLLETRAQMKLLAPSIDVVFHEMEGNLHESKSFARYWRGKADHVRVYPISRSFADVERNFRPDGFRTRTCTYLWNRMPILWNGDVTRCMADVNGETAVGNLRNQSIADLWNCNESMDLKAWHRSSRDFRDLGLCARCDW